MTRLCYNPKFREVRRPVTSTAAHVQPLSINLNPEPPHIAFKTNDTRPSSRFLSLSSPWPTTFSHPNQTLDSSTLPLNSTPVLTLAVAGRVHLSEAVGAPGEARGLAHGQGTQKVGIDKEGCAWIWGVRKDFGVGEYQGQREMTVRNLAPTARSCLCFRP